jgi:nifR3 family TIM-barrel protein
MYNFSVMKIGNIEIKGFAALAPMAGVADRAMREICRKHGSAFSVGELTSSKGISVGDKKSHTLLFCGEKERPMASQLFGREPETMAEAAKKALEFNPDFIDINMGCPAPKVSGNGGGSALLKDLPLAQKIVKAVVEAVDIPVTVKMRTGWDENSLVSPQLAKMCEDAGARAITIHGRTKKQMYAEGIDFKTIAETVKAVNIPVIANGDICDGKSAKYMYEATGCDFLMVGRAARGNPFVFEEINAYMENRSYTPPNLEKRFETLMEQVRRMVEYKADRRAFLEARKHTAWYMQGLKGAAELRRMAGAINSYEDIEAVCQKALELNKDLW